MPRPAPGHDRGRGGSDGVPWHDRGVRRRRGDAAAGQVLLGCAVVLAAPRLNAPAIGALAALRGFAGVVPLCLGVACGVGTLVALLCLALSGALPEPGRWGDAGRIAGAVLLLCIALRLFHRKASAAAAAGSARLSGFCGGFCTAVSNPVTAAFFASQLVGAAGAASGPAFSWSLAPLRRPSRTACSWPACWRARGSAGRRRPGTVRSAWPAPPRCWRWPA